MSTLFIDIILEGDQFSPRKLVERTGLTIKSLAEYNEISNRGRYKGKKSPYGLAVLKVESSTIEKLNNVLNDVLNYLIIIKLELNQSGVEEVSLDLETYEGNTLNIETRNLKKIDYLNSELKNFDTEFNLYEIIKLNYEPLVYFIDNRIFKEILYSLNANNLQSNINSNDKQLKMRFILYNILQYKFLNFQLTQTELIKAVNLYISKYIEFKIEDIPPFKNVLKEKNL